MQEVIESTLESAARLGGMLSSREVQNLLRYPNAGPFWEFVRREAVPHVRLSRRNIRFPAAALKQWLNSRSNVPVTL